MYLRTLSLLEREGRETISSLQLAQRLHLNPPQIRKDLSYFGAFGTRGIGYPIPATAQRIRSILHLHVKQKVGIVGAGRLGTAIAAYPGFVVFGFEIAAIFDNDPVKLGRRIGGIEIEEVSGLVSLKERGIRLAVLAVPSEAAQECAELLVQAGVKGILNLSPHYLDVPKRVKVVSIDMATALGVLPFYTL